LHFLEVILVYKFLFLRHQINSSQQRIFLSWCIAILVR
jgi:hypothetical protein